MTYADLATLYGALTPQGQFRVARRLAAINLLRGDTIERGNPPQEWLAAILGEKE